MFKEYNYNFQYDSCVSRGVCSINPRNSALQTVLVLYLRLFAKLSKKESINDKLKEFILNTISITIYNLEFNEKSFLYTVNTLKKELSSLIEKVDKKYIDDVELEKAKELFLESTDVIKSIQYGEKILNKVSKNLRVDIRDLYNIMLVITKSLSINLLDLESYKKKEPKAFSIILELLSQINIETKNPGILKKIIDRAVKIDNELIKQIRLAQEERYGRQRLSQVSYSTVPNKAVLVVGSNIRELEIILNGLSKEDIDVYTHDDMMLAHTFPKFATYPRLKGQYGQGLENCQLDFATFPGPIILTKHSLHNIENFYRGQLFTTDYMLSPVGIIKIENNDFSKVIDKAKKSKGFKNGKQCETVNIGFDYDLTLKEIKEKILSEKYSQIVIIGPNDYSIEQKAYFDKFIKLIDKNILVISFSYEEKTSNLLYINTCFDNYSWIKVFNELQKLDLPISIFKFKCERNSISQIIYLSKFNNVKIFLGKCTPILLNPTLIKTLKKIFNIETIETVKKDLEKIYKDK